MRLYGFLLPKPKLSQVLAKQQSAVGCVLSTDTPLGVVDNAEQVSFSGS